ncbi:MAG: hypothetical protein ACKN9V_03650 [Pseudomonadota bacterium]
MKIFSQSSEKLTVKSFLIILAAILLLNSLAQGARNSGSIIQVQRKIRMSDAEPLPPKEYFIDLGQRDGLQAGERLEVYRELPVTNGQSGAPWHVLRVKIGELRVDYLGETSSLAREVEGRDLASLPPLEYQTFMLGDEVFRRTGLQNKTASP